MFQCALFSDESVKQFTQFIKNGHIKNTIQKLDTHTHTLKKLFLFWFGDIVIIISGASSIGKCMSYSGSIIFNDQTNTAPILPSIQVSSGFYEA